MEKLVLLLRHGIAEARGGSPDAERSLTQTGHKRMREIGRALDLVFPNAEAIVTSPLRRCVQSAAWVAKAYGDHVAVTTSDALRPESDARALKTLIAETAGARLILVGHEPNLTEAMLALTAMQADSGVELKKGGCYRLRVAEHGEASLEWMLPPRVLRATQ